MNDVPPSTHISTRSTLMPHLVVASSRLPAIEPEMLSLQCVT